MEIIERIAWAVCMVMATGGSIVFGYNIGIEDGREEGCKLAGHQASEIERIARKQINHQLTEQSKDIQARN